MGSKELLIELCPSEYMQFSPLFVVDVIAYRDAYLMCDSVNDSS